MQNPALFLKRYLPKSLFGRALMILVLPMVLLQAVVAFLFIQRHYDGVTAQMAASVARELNYAIDQVEKGADTASVSASLEQIAGPFGFEIGLAEGEKIEFEALRSFYDLTGGSIAETLKLNVRRPLAVDLVNFDKHVDVKIATSKGVLRVLIPRRRMNAANPHLLLVWMVGTAVLLIGVATVFLRNQIRPIRDLAVTASAFGRGRSVPFRPGGADEVRRAGAAFLDMRNRIERHVEQRTRMLSGVSHDLKTPLTRMKLALAVADETPENDELARDVTEMEHMLAAFLAFARGEGGEASGPASPADLADEIASDARRKGASITVFCQIETPEQPLVDMRRRALKRGLANLVDNAILYGGAVAVSVRLTAKFVEFMVEDDGPGIPEDKRVEVLRPFTRLDEARNQDVASGTGLGLSIALDIARSHGGSLKLHDSERLGGLCVSMLIPR